MCWLAGASGLLEICHRDGDADWRLSLSAQGGATFQGGRSHSASGEIPGERKDGTRGVVPPRVFTSMTSAEVMRLSLAALEHRSVDSVRSLCHFQNWETVADVLRELRTMEAARCKAKAEAVAGLKEGQELEEGWKLSMWLPAADVMHEFLFELLRAEAPHTIVRLAADIAQLAAPALVDFSPTGEGSPTLDMYLQQLPLPCLSRCAGWSLQLMQDMQGVSRHDIAGIWVAFFSRYRC